MVSRRSFMSPQNSPVTFPSADASLKDFRQRLSLDHRKAEPEVLSSLIARARLSIPERDSVVQQALGLLAGLRAAQEQGWVNQVRSDESRVGKECVSTWRSRWATYP